MNRRGPVINVPGPWFFILSILSMYQLRVTPVNRRWTQTPERRGYVTANFHFESGVDRLDGVGMQETNFLYVSI